MLKIRSYKYLWKLGYYDPQSFIFRWDSIFSSYKNWKNKKKSFSINEDGITGTIENIRSFLFRYNDQLYLDYGKKRIEIYDNTEIKMLLVENKILSFKIIQDDKILLQIHYKPQNSLIPLENDFTPFIDASNFDFGINVYNTLLDKEFRKKLFKNYDYKQKMFKSK